MIESGTPLQILFNLLLYIVGFSFIRKANKSRGCLSKENSVYIFILFLLFCLFPFWGGDYFNYKMEFDIIRKKEFTTLEDFYVFIVESIPNSYLLFRMLIWGSAVILLFKLFDLNKGISAYAIMFFFSLYLPWYSYARVSLAMVVMFLGGYYIIISKDNKRLLNSILCGIVLLSISFFLHRSAFYGIFIIIVCLLFRNYEKKHILLTLAMFPIIILLTKSFVSQFLMYETDEMLIDAYAGQSYMNAEKYNDGPGMIVGNFLQYSTFYLCLFLIGKCIWKGIFIGFPEVVKFFGCSAALIIISASIFSFDLGANTNVLYYRFLNFAMIPSAFFLAYCYKNKIYRRLVHNIYVIGSFAAFYAIFYAFYCSFFS